MPDAAIATDKLRRPSVVEAVCEFRFAHGISYTVIPGMMRERLRSKFPTFEVLPTATLMAGIPDEVLLPHIPHHRFKSQQPNALVQTGPRLLTVNLLPVYPGFDVFRALILEVQHHYSEVAEAGNPVKVSLRYINLIQSSSAEADLRRYLKISFSYPGELPKPAQEIAARLVLSYGDLGTLGFAIAFPSRIATGEVGALLDLEFSWDEPRVFDLSHFPEWLEEAHQVIFKAFTSTVAENIMAEMRG